MIPLRLDAPLRHLRELAGKPKRPLSHRALGMLVEPMVSGAAVVDAEQRGPRIRLSTLAMYARAAGYMLWIDGRGAGALELRHQVHDGHTMSVAEARVLIDGWGLEMVLAVEPAERSDG